MGYNRFRSKARLKRQYTLTKTKMFAGFLLSTFFSIILSPYFDKYGPEILSQTKNVFVQTFNPPAKNVVADSSVDNETMKEEAKSMNDLDQRLRRLRQNNNQQNANFKEN